MLPAPQLPSARAHRFSLAEVLPNSFAALRGERGGWDLPRVRTAVVVLVDGLGAMALEARAGHARRMLGASRPGVIGSGFPTTTVSALATFTTGEPPGRHGLVGYRGFDPARDRVVNHLTGWDPELDPTTWQRVPTLFERNDDIRSIAIGPRKHRESAFTAAVLRGAEYREADPLAVRFERARESAGASERALLYLYVPELDIAAHHYGFESPAWTAALETLDAAVADFAAQLRPDQGMLLTADHGILDVDRAAQVVIPPALLEGVRHIAGEPRSLQLHLAPDLDPVGVADRWREAEGARAWIATRDEAIEAGWFGPVDDDVRPRIGDVLVAARKRVAYYADPLDRGRAMIGQHGSLRPEETGVPLLRFGAFA